MKIEAVAGSSHCARMIVVRKGLPVYYELNRDQGELSDVGSDYVTGRTR